MSLRGPKVALMQPTFLPWLGYFGLLRDADVFVFLDDFQFVRRSFHQRNRIFTGGGKADFISLPVEHPGQQNVPLNCVRPCPDAQWKKKFPGTIRHNYGGSPWLVPVMAMIEDWLAEEHESLAAFNISFIMKALGVLGLERDIRLSSELDVRGVRSERILGLLERCGAGTYLSARGAFGYMREDGVFPVDHIDVVFQDFTPRPYVQKQSKDFVSHLSILDALLQIGPVETMKNIDSAADSYKSWQEMEEMQKDEHYEPDVQDCRS